MTDVLTFPKFSLSERAIELLAWHKSKSANAMPSFRPGFITLIHNHAGDEVTLPSFDRDWLEAAGVRLETNARCNRIVVEAPESWRWRLKRNRVLFIPTELCNRFTLYPKGSPKVVCYRASSADFAVSVTIPFGESFPAPLAAVWSYAKTHQEQLFYV